MRDARSLLLQLGATALTLATTVVSALYVTSHLKNPNAPLQPTVLSTSQSTSVGVPGGGTISLAPSSVQPTDLPAVTSTYAS